MGALVGALLGFYLLMGIIVLKARFGSYIYALHDLQEFRLDTLVVILGISAGAAIGYRAPIQFLRAVLRGLGVAILSLPFGALLGRVVWGSGAGVWAGAVVFSSLALVAATVLALRVGQRRGFKVPDLAPAAIVLAAAAVAVVIGLRDPEAVETVEVDPAPLPLPSEIEEIVFVVGDGGATEAGRAPLLEALAQDVERWSEALDRDSAVSVLYPGDLVYPVGVRDRDHPEFPVDSARLWNQIQLVAGPAARAHGTLGLFQPGNHDWGNTADEEGIDRIRNLSDQLEMAREDGLKVSLLPADGEPGPEIRDVRDHLRMMFLDTHWYLKPQSESDRQAFLSEVREGVHTAGARHVILSAHHPYQSAGPHGAIVPGLHAWGVGYLMRRTGALVQDLNSPAYASLLASLRQIFEEAPRPPLMFVGGHDHSLQVLEREAPSDPAFTVVSGAGSKVSSIRTLPTMRYGAGRPGWVMLVFLKDGGVSLFVVGGSAELLRCDGEPRGPLEACLNRGANAFDIVYGQVLVEGPDGSELQTDGAGREEVPAGGVDDLDEGEVADAGNDDAPEPGAASDFAWWIRDVIPPDHEIAEADRDVPAPPPAVPARVLYFRPDSVEATSGASYAAGALQSVVLGDLNRHLWDIPIKLPVLDLDTLGGGVEVVELTGGRQTLGLLFRGADGVEYQFRSIVKDAGRALSETWDDTPVESLVQDQLAAQFPLAATVVTELLEAVDVLVAPTRAVILPHDERLGPYRPFFGGRMGWIEERPNERGEDRPGFADSRKIVGGNEIYDELGEANAEVEIDLYLRTRFVDFLVGDWDRHSDNLRWARFDEDGRSVWEPIPRDRDWALSRTGGVAGPVSRGVMPRFVGFTEEIPPPERIAAAGSRIDRRILGGVPETRFLEQARVVRDRITPDVIEAALSTLPPPYQERERPALNRALASRVGQLERAASEFHGYVSTQVHVYGLDEVADTVRLDRTPQGLARVRVYSTTEQEGPRLHWLLDPSETQSVELFLDADADALIASEDFPLEVSRFDPEELAPDEGGGSR